MHCAHAREGLGEFSKAIQGVDVGRLPVLCEREAVELASLHQVERGPAQVAVCRVQGDGVSDKIYSLIREAEVLEEVCARHLREVAVLVRARVLLLVVLYVDQEVAEAPLLEEAHEPGLEGFCLCGRHFVDVTFLEDEGAINLLELEVVRRLGMQQHLHQLARSHHELWDEVNVVVPARSQLRRGLLPVAVLLEHLVQGEGGALAPVVGVAVHVEHLLARDGHEAG
mmetsp:Transcript_15753/g.42303  ORF Transcript_15753/g.42303 Transcript_15753/m.42303 type:complete len:226 (+) Transcript_15753:946-1623(+)